VTQIAAGKTALRLYAKFETDCFTFTVSQKWIGSKIIPSASQASLDRKACQLLELGSQGIREEE
jgi:hypothetical protein